MFDSTSGGSPSPSDPPILDSRSPSSQLRQSPPTCGKILVIDDNDSVRDAVGAFFQSRAEVVPCVDGQQALDQLRQQTFGVVVSDIDLPLMDGIEILNAARKSCPGIAARYVFISGGINSERRSFLREHHIRYLRKPFRFSELRNMVDEILREAQERAKEIVSTGDPA